MHHTNTVVALLTVCSLVATSPRAVAGGRATLLREATEFVTRRGTRELAEKATRETAEQVVEAGVTKLGAEAVELEVKAPGLTRTVFTVFGDDAARKIATTVPAEDLPRLVSYAERADTPQTRALLLEAYEREGRSLFERIPAKLVLTGGLTTAMIYGTHRASAPMAALGTQIENNPDLAGRALDWMALIGGAVVLLVTTVLLRWLGLFRRRQPAAAPNTPARAAPAPTA